MVFLENREATDNVQARGDLCWFGCFKRTMWCGAVNTNQRAVVRAVEDFSCHYGQIVITNRSL